MDFDGGSACEQEDAAISTLPDIQIGFCARRSVVRTEDSTPSREGSDIFRPPPA
jgi:hypothetical protein